MPRGVLEGGGGGVSRSTASRRWSRRALQGAPSSSLSKPILPLFGSEATLFGQEAALLEADVHAQEGRYRLLPPSSSATRAGFAQGLTGSTGKGSCAANHVDG